MSFLQAVLQKIRPHSPEALPTRTVSDLAEQISRYNHLFELQQKRQLLEVICMETGRTYQSMILGINLAEQTVELDEFFPQPYGQPHRVGDQFQVRHHQNGQVLRFAGAIECITQTRTGSVYSLTLPTRIEYRQRRQHPRIVLNRQTPLTVRLQSPRKTPWFATASNLSAGGMRLTVGGNVADQLLRGSRLPLCEFSLMQDFEIRCEAQVRSFRFLRRPYRHTEISIEFTNLEPATRQQLRRIIDNVNMDSAAA